MIGIDIITIKRFKNKPQSFLRKIFTSKEIEEANRANFYEKIAGKWAAKEAAYKAGLKYVNKEIEILTIDKKPNIFIKGKKKQYMLSISHEKNYAIAVVFNNEKS